MKKGQKKAKMPKYQFAGPVQQKACGEGTVWNAEFQMCVPVYNYDVVPIDGIDPTGFKKFQQRLGQKPAGQERPQNDGSFYQTQPQDYAAAQGFNLDSDGVYRKAQVTENKGKQQYSEFFQGLNPLLDLTQFVGNAVQDYRTEQQDQNTLNKARYKKSRYNVNEKGYNNVPVYLQQGGKTPIYTTDPKDPRLQAYNDSLTLYNTTVGQDKLLENTKTYNDWKTFANNWNKKYGNLTGGAYQRLNSPKPEKIVTKQFAKTPTLNESAEAWLYKKPVQPVVYNKPYEDLQDMYGISQVDIKTPNLSGLPVKVNVQEPNFKQSNPDYISAKPTKYSFTNYDDTKTYFKNKQALQQFIKATRNTSSQEGDNYMTATGYFQTGGSVVDYLISKGKKASFADRKKEYGHLFKEGYTGTAEQNIKLLNYLTSNAPSQSIISKAAGVAKGEKKKAPIQSGLIVDKRTGNAYIVKNGKAIEQFPVLTGRNKDLNANPYTLDQLDKNPNLRNTPIGSYKANPVGDIYGMPGYSLNPIAAFGENAPNAADLALHITYDPAHRDKYYGKQSNQSYGCVNCRKPDLQNILQQFPKGDTVVVVDSKLPKGKKVINNIQQIGGSVNSTGYLNGAKTNTNPYNIIPGGNITTENMAFPIMANGIPLYPNTGDYQFNSKYVVETPMGYHKMPDGTVMANNEMKNGGKWIPKNLKKGRCADMGGPDCPEGSPQYNLAMTFKKHHGFHKMQIGGVPEVGGSANPNATLEQGEVFQQQSGQIQKVAESEPRHESQQGGSPQANVERVLEDTGDKRKDKTSKLLLVKPDEVKAMFDFKPKRSLTHSKLYEQVVEKDAKDLKKVEKTIEKNLDYVKHHGGTWAQNSLDENLKLLATAPTNQERFDEVYAHQEAKKQLYNIDNEQDKKWGGKMYKYQIGGSNYRKIRQDKYMDTRPPYPQAFENYYDTNKQLQYNAPDWITPNQFYGTPGLIDYMKTLDTIPGVDNDLHKADDAVWGYRHQAALEKYFPQGKPVTQVPQPAQVATPQPVTTDNTKYTLPKEAVASTVNEGLGWSGGYGNLLGLINSFGRTPVGLEQLDAPQLRAHEEDVRPVINANLSDYNAATAQMPQSGVGYANQANLQGQKYRADNQAVAAVETRNKQKADQVDAINAQTQFGVDQTNLGLRDQFVNRVLLGKEKQRQQKFEYINGLFKAIDERNAFNRNASLALQTTPYFDQYAHFNGNKYQLGQRYNINNGQSVQYIEDPQSGQQFRVIYDKNGKLISSSKVVKDNAATNTNKVNVK